MATNRPQTVSTANPWLAVLGLVTVLLGLAGVVLTSSADPTDPDYNPIAAAFGPPLLAAAGALLAGLLVAGAICWQIRQR